MAKNQAASATLREAATLMREADDPLWVALAHWLDIMGDRADYVEEWEPVGDEFAPALAVARAYLSQ